ncbi:LysR family transcriptional regulator [Oxalobacter aliiformigenes]|uniref:LysR family transcriptional regulator n=1 Tax=Oxalobacter aliiformigenes TaxID=2946593 RepID=A0A9E9NQR0_9BURK|nr:LysR family transcriptional regulator [Oxalobacter aliiformigenes]WAV88530.1 LysR family transcriptional regulator [Oxalobacter aliiformigenes]WAV90559.1 LysR family transcriptional regulator [Oxalobacter aliiformigenes]WAV92592.1 LysR family transcriptional regulator [Oxalobacter aliiformigenes]WAV95900.1 LysR family transcriptional regulator [Oxalobacter aliiformigenes]WAV96308.1 LysR family transcriptional regulator [Oxalobacter aliiformigenes]
MIDSELTIRKLEIFLAFMEKRNIARTAEMLGISGVSVHRALHSLEDVLRCPLFVQDGRNLRPLPAARTLAHYAKEMVLVIRRAIDATREAAGYGRGRMKLGCLYSLTTELVPRLIMGLKRRRPEMEIDLSMNSSRELLAQLNEGQLDAILVSLPGKKVELAGLETLPLFEDTFYLAVPLSSSVPLAEPVELADLKEEKFVTMNDGFATAQCFSDAFAEAGFEPVVVTRLNDIFSLMNMVQAGVGLSLVPRRIGKVFDSSVRLVGLAEKYRKKQTVALVFPKSRERDPDILALVAEARMMARHSTG